MNAYEPTLNEQLTDTSEYQLIFLLNDEAFGIDVADQAVLSVSPELARDELRGQLSDEPQLALDLGSPVRVEYLIKRNRLPNRVLKTLPANDPERVLHQYIVATYDIPSDVDAIYQNTKSQVELDTEYSRYAGWKDDIMPIKFVEKNIKFSFSAIPNDTYYLKIQRPLMKGIMGFERAWDYTKGYARLGIVDSGIEENHPEFKHTSNKFNYLKRYSLAIPDDGDEIYGYADEKNLESYSLKEKGHGTHVAGIIGAASNNTTGVVGVCQECPFTVVSQNNRDADLARGIKHNITAGAVAINLSLGVYRGDDYCRKESNSAICQAIQLAKKI